MKEIKVSTLVWLAVLIISIIFLTIKFYTLERCGTDGDCNQAFEDLRTSIKILWIATSITICYVVALILIKK